MRRAALGLFLIAGCGGDADHPELHFDVRVTGSLLYVSATEVDRPEAANQLPFAHPGDCDETSDGWSCDGDCPGAWLGELSLVRNGEVIDEVLYDAPWGSGFALDGELGDAVLVIEDADGAEVEVPIPGPTRPIAVIDAVDITDAGVSREDVEITWHTNAGADTAVVEVSGGFGGPRCHVDRTEDVTTLQTSAGSAIGVAMVTAFAAPVTVETAFGPAEVWIGDTTSFDFRSSAR